MKLRKYLKERSFSTENFARAIGFSRVHLSRVMTGKKKASKKILMRIYLITKGEIKTEEDIVDQEKRDPKEQKAADQF